MTYIEKPNQEPGEHDIPGPRTNSAQTQPPAWSRALLDAIPYRRQNANGKTYLALQMPGRKLVRKSHFEEVWNLFWASVHLHKTRRKHTTKELCKDPRWEERPRGRRIAFGRCMKYFYDHGVLPITLANPHKKSGSWQYRLWPDLSTHPPTH